MRGAVLGSQVGLDLDDPAHAALARRRTARVAFDARDGVPNEEGAEEGLGGIERRTGQALPREPVGRRAAGAQGAKTSFTEGGKAAPKMSRMNGAIRSRTIVAVSEPSNAEWISRTNGNSGPDTSLPTVR